MFQDKVKQTAQLSNSSFARNIFRPVDYSGKGLSECQIARYEDPFWFTPLHYCLGVTLNGLNESVAYHLMPFSDNALEAFELVGYDHLGMVVINSMNSMLTTEVQSVGLFSPKGKDNWEHHGGVQNAVRQMFPNIRIDHLKVGNAGYDPQSQQYFEYIDPQDFSTWRKVEAATSFYEIEPVFEA